MIAIATALDANEATESSLLQIVGECLFRKPFESLSEDELAASIGFSDFCDRRVDFLDNKDIVPGMRSVPDISIADKNAMEKVLGTLLAQREAIVANASSALDDVNAKIRTVRSLIGKPAPDEMESPSDYFTRSELQGRKMSEKAVWALQKIGRPAKAVEIVKVLSAALPDEDVAKIRAALAKALERHKELFNKNGFRWSLVRGKAANGEQDNADSA